MKKTKVPREPLAVRRIASALLKGREIATAVDYLTSLRRTSNLEFVIIKAAVCVETLLQQLIAARMNVPRVDWTVDLRWELLCRIAFLDAEDGTLPEALRKLGESRNKAAHHLGSPIVLARAREFHELVSSRPWPADAKGQVGAIINDTTLVLLVLASMVEQEVTGERSVVLDLLDVLNDGTITKRQYKQRLRALEAESHEALAQVLAARPQSVPETRGR